MRGQGNECINIKTVHVQQAYYFYLHGEFSGQVLGLVEITYRLKLLHGSIKCALYYWVYTRLVRRTL